MLSVVGVQALQRVPKLAYMRQFYIDHPAAIGNLRNIFRFFSYDSAQYLKFPAEFFLFFFFSLLTCCC